MKTLYIRDLTKEEIEAINVLKKETASATMAKAVRKGILAYLRILADYKKCVTENIRLKQELTSLKKSMAQINALSVPFSHVNGKK